MCVRACVHAMLRRETAIEIGPGAGSMQSGCGYNLPLQPAMPGYRLTNTIIV